MRHAKSDWYSGENEDFLRPLSERGIRDARRIGRWMAEDDRLPEWIVSSPARRTRETLSLLAEGAGVDLSERVEWVDALYHSSVEVILSVLGTQRDRRNLMLLGHNPGVEDLLRYLLAGNAAESGYRKQVPTGAVYILESARALDKLERGCAEVVAHARPNALAD